MNFRILLHHCLVQILIFCFPILPNVKLVHAIRKTRLTWVNGIGYQPHHMLRGQQAISKLFGGKDVLFCHNPTSMTNDEDQRGYLRDLTQAGSQKLGYSTTEVKALVQHLKAAVEAVGVSGVVVHIAHSQGALLTSLAAKELTKLEMSQIEILAFGGAAVVKKTVETPFSRCINYYSVNDPLLFVVPKAAQALRSGFVADDEFCFLAPRSGDPIEDHSLLGPTYAKALSWEGQRFQQHYQSLALRSFRIFLIFVIHLAYAIWNKIHTMTKEATQKLVSFLLLVWDWLQNHSKLLKFIQSSTFKTRTAEVTQ